MTVLRQGAFADARPFPSDILNHEIATQYPIRALSDEFAVDTRSLAALRLPGDLRCVGFNQSTLLKPAVSIVVPVHNRRHTLNRAVHSALALRDFSSIEVVVVDDGSNDGTTAVLKELDDPRVSAVGLLRRQGANTARNVGIAIARAPVIAFLDSDDNYSDGRLSDPLYLLAQNPEVGVVISSFVSRKANTDRMLRLREEIYDGEAFLRLIASYVLPPSSSGLTIRRELLLKCGGFDPRVRRMQDRDLLLRLAPLTKAASSAVVSWHKHWRSDGISSSRDSYYEALCEFLALHPIYRDQELATRNYLIARHLIDLVKRGLTARAFEIYRHARTSLSPRVQPLPLLLLAYLTTKQRRRKAAARVLARSRQPTHAMGAETRRRPFPTGHRAG